MHGSDATATKHTSTTATALQLHCTSGSHCGWSRFPVIGFFQVVGQVGRSVAQSVEVTPKRSTERGGWSRRLQGRSPKTNQRLERQSLEKSSRPGQPKAVGRVKASGNLYTKSSRPGLSSVAGQVKAPGSPVELACLIQRDRTSEVFW